MASVTKVVSGNTTTFTVTDSTGASATMTVNTGAVTGNTVTYGGSALRQDGQAIISSLNLMLQTGLIPGNGYFGLTP